MASVSKICLIFFFSILIASVAVTVALYEADGVDIRVKLVAVMFKWIAKFSGMTHQDGQPFPVVSNILSFLNKPIPADLESRSADLNIPTLQFHTNALNISEKFISISRLHIPQNAINSSEPVGIIVWYHGGGFVLGSSSDYSAHGFGAKLCEETGLYVLHVEYRLAPKFKFPHGLEDSYSVLYWLSQLDDACLFSSTNKSLCSSYAPVDTKNVHLGGDSAGGNYAVGSALLWHYRGPSVSEHTSPEVFEGVQFYHEHGYHSVGEDTFKIQSLLLAYPSLFPRDVPESYRKFADTYFISKPTRTYFRYAYFPDDDDEDYNDEDDDTSVRKRMFLHPYVSAFNSPYLHTLPKALFLLAEIDPLLDEGKAFHKVLKELNVTTECHLFNNVPHGFVTVSFLPQANEALGYIKEFIKN